MTDNLTYNSSAYIRKLYKSESLLEVLLTIEDYLDNMDMYSFKNWQKGAVVQGPLIQRYWVEVTLRYDYKEMPDPEGALRLLGQGIYVHYQKAWEALPPKLRTNFYRQKVTTLPKGLDDAGVETEEEKVRLDRQVNGLGAADQLIDPNNPYAVGNPNRDNKSIDDQNVTDNGKEQVWLVTLSFPRKILDEVVDQQLLVYDQQLDTEETTDARDEGFDTTYSYADEKQTGNAESGNNETGMETGGEGGEDILGGLI